MIVTFINVGYGDSILIEWDGPKGRYNMLVDGGRPDIEHYRGSSHRIRTVDYLKKKGIEKIDLLVVTHLHKDHVGGLLDVVSAVEVEEMWSNYVFPEECIGKKVEAEDGFNSSAINLLNSLNLYNEICFILKEKGKSLREIKGIELDTRISGEFAVDIFGAEYNVAAFHKRMIDSIYKAEDPSEIERMLLELKGSVNDASLALRLIFGNTKVFLCGDVYSNYWEPIISLGMPLSADILKLSHHGRADGTSEAFARQVAPKYAIVSTINRYDGKGADPKVMEMLGDISRSNNGNIKILFTDAVDMPPYSTSQSQHNAIEFLLNEESGITYEFV